MVGIQKLVNSDEIPEFQRDLTFLIWQDIFSEIDSPTGVRMINTTNDLIDFFNEIENIEHQALLRKKPTTPENPSIEDDFYCAFLQRNPVDNSSALCQKEKDQSKQSTCQYWQTCDFTAVKGRTCDVIASRVVALVIPIVILLLTTAIFAIYCFRKKAQRAEAENQFINDVLPVFPEEPVFQEPNPSSSNNRRSILPTLNKDNSLKKGVYNGNASVIGGATPGEL